MPPFVFGLILLRVVNLINRCLMDMLLASFYWWCVVKDMLAVLGDDREGESDKSCEV